MPLLLALLVVAVAAGAFYFLRGNNSAATAKPTATVKKHPPAVRDGKGKRTRPGARHQRQRTRPRVVRFVKLHRYAFRLVPIIDRSLRVFNRGAAEASRNSGSQDALDRACIFWGAKVEYVQGQMEGVPHVSRWYQPVGRLHHRAAGVYHAMLGSMSQCQTAAEGSDAGAMASAVAQIGESAARMRRLAADVHRMARLPR
jgi:hypothetical protein